MLNANELTQKIHQIKELQRMSEELTAELEALKDEVKQTMTEQNTDTLVIDCYKVTWKPVTTNRIDTTAIKRECPEIAERYTKVSESKRRRQLHAGLDQLIAYHQAHVSAAHHQDPLPRPDAVEVHQGLSRSGAHDAGEGPSGEGDHILSGSRRHDDGVRFVVGGLALHVHQDLLVVVDPHDHRV